MDPGRTDTLPHDAPDPTAPRGPGYRLSRLLGQLASGARRLQQGVSRCAAAAAPFWSREADYARPAKDIFDETALASCAEELATFERDGYAVLPAVMTPEARHSWVDALRELQDQNDECVRSVLFRLFPAPPDDPDRFLGGAQLILGQQNPGWIDEPERWAAVAAMREHGVIPE